RKKSVVLRDVAKAASVRLNVDSLLRVPERLARDGESTARGHDEAGYRLQGKRLARPRGPEQNEHTGRKIELDIDFEPRLASADRDEKARLERSRVAHGTSGLGVSRAARATTTRESSESATTYIVARRSSPSAYAVKISIAIVFVRPRTFPANMSVAPNSP